MYSQDLTDAFLVKRTFMSYVDTFAFVSGFGYGCAVDCLVGVGTYVKQITDKYIDGDDSTNSAGRVATISKGIPVLSGGIMYALSELNGMDLNSEIFLRSTIAFTAGVLTESQLKNMALKTKDVAKEKFKNVYDAVRDLKEWSKN